VKNRHRFLLSACLLLAGCELNASTEIDASGAGLLRSEVGFTPEERRSLEEQAGNAADFCGVGRAPASMTIAEELRGEQTWCITTITFSNLDELRRAYGENEGVTVKRLELTDGIIYYDLDLDTSSPESSLSGFSRIQWEVQFPGTILRHNADERSGGGLIWEIEPHAGTIRVWAEGRAEAAPHYSRLPTLLILGVLMVVAAILYARMRRASAGGLPENEKSRPDAAT